MITNAGLIVLHVANAILAMILLYRALRLHFVLSEEVKKEAKIMQQRRSLKPQCLQNIRAAISVSILYLIMNFGWVLKRHFLKISISEDAIWSIVEMLFILTILKSLQLSAKVIEYGRMRRNIDSVEGYDAGNTLERVHRAERCR